MDPIDVSNITSITKVASDRMPNSVTAFPCERYRFEGKVQFVCPGRYSESDLKSGYLPRPPGTERFQLTHVSIQVSREIHGFDANRDVDPVVFAAALRNGIVPGSFAFAKFHEPRWHSSKDGVEAIDKAIDHLQRMLNEPECRAMDCDSLLEVLHAVKERLLRAAELHLKFYFLGTDRSVACWRINPGDAGFPLSRRF